MKLFKDFKDTLKPMYKVLDKMEAPESVEKLAAEFLMDANEFIPMDVKKLKRSSIQKSVLRKGLVVWDTPYAARLFYNPQYNFRKDRNPNARGLWAEYAKEVNRDKYKETTNKTFEQSKDEVFT